MIAYSGRTASKLKTENKPIKEGYQRLTLADQSGYSSTWDYWIPRISIWKAPKLAELGRKASAVPYLTKQLPQLDRQQYHLYLDNFFVSLRLVIYLRNLPNPIGVTGTSKSNAGHPQATIDILAELANRRDKLIWGESTGYVCTEEISRSSLIRLEAPESPDQSEAVRSALPIGGPGSRRNSGSSSPDPLSLLDWISCPPDLPIRASPVQPLLQSNAHLCNSITWIDQKVTLWMTSVYEHPDTGLRTRVIRHGHRNNPKIDFTRSFGTDNVRDLPIPEMVDDYNHGMGGVDLGNQFRAEFDLDRRFSRIWRPLAMDLVKIWTKNAFILYRIKAEEPHLIFKDFRDSLLVELKQIYTESGNAHTRRLGRSRGSQLVSGIPESRRCIIGWRKAGKLRQCQACTANKRERRHRVLAESVSAANRRPARTIYVCQGCEIPLCHDDACWDSWHRRKYLPN